MPWHLFSSSSSSSSFACVISLLLLLFVFASLDVVTPRRHDAWRLAPVKELAPKWWWRTRNHQQLPGPVIGGQTARRLYVLMRVRRHRPTDSCCWHGPKAASSPTPLLLYLYNNDNNNMCMKMYSSIRTQQYLFLFTDATNQHVYFWIFFLWQWIADSYRAQIPISTRCILLDMFSFKRNENKDEPLACLFQYVFSFFFSGCIIPNA